MPPCISCQDILAILEAYVPSVDKEPEASVLIVDGSALVHALPPNRRHLRTMQLLTSYQWSTCTPAKATIMLRVVLNIDPCEHVTNEHLYSGLPKLSDRVAARRMKLAGQASSMGAE